MPLTDDTAITIAGVTCWDEGTVEQISGGKGARAERTVRCHWEDRGALAAALLGGTTEVGGLPQFESGAPYPDFSAWLAKDARIKGDGIMSVGPSGMVAYEWAVLTITYGPPDFPTGSGNANLIGAEELEFSATTVAVSSDDATFKWTDGPNAGRDLPPTMVPAFSVSTIGYTKSRFNLSSIPIPLVRDLIDCSNSTTFLGAPAETVVFRGGRSKRNITAAGAQNWDMDYRFEENVHGWNKLPDGANGWRSFTLKNGDKLFPPKDLNQLFA